MKVNAGDITLTTSPRGRTLEVVGMIEGGVVYPMVKVLPFEIDDKFKHQSPELRGVPIVYCEPDANTIKFWPATDVEREIRVRFYPPMREE